MKEYLQTKRLHLGDDAVVGTDCTEEMLWDCFGPELVSNGLRWKEKMDICLGASKLRWRSESLSLSKQDMPQKQGID